MSEHSPGPWQFDDKCYAIYRGDGWPCVASFSDADLPTPADGRLMASAPEMLRLLRVLVGIDNGSDDYPDNCFRWRGAMIRASELIARLDGDQ